jgi:hypothetical protein
MSLGGRTQKARNCRVTGPSDLENTLGPDRGHGDRATPHGQQTHHLRRGCRERLGKSRPTRPCGGPRMNPSVDDGNPPRPFRHLRVAEHCTPDQIFESSSRSFGVGSKIGYHHHQPCRSTFKLDARGKPAALARGQGKKVGTRLASNSEKGNLPANHRRRVRAEVQSLLVASAGPVAETGGHEGGFGRTGMTPRSALTRSALKEKLTPFWGRIVKREIRWRTLPRPTLFLEHFVQCIH